MGTPAGFVLVGLLFFCLHHSCFAEDEEAPICQAFQGKKVYTFSNTKEVVKLPCKYNAVKDLLCGDWKLTVTPGNMLENHRNKQYVVSTMFVVVTNVNNNKFWEGRSDLKIAKKYKLGLEDAPFRKKGGDLETSDVFTYGEGDKEVSITEKNNQFKITFGLFSPRRAWHKSSGFKFQCFSSTFVPSGYPTQLCGNGTENEVKLFKKGKKWKGNRVMVMFRNIFANTEIVQTDVHCKAAAKSMQKDCATEEDQFFAAKRCWVILHKGKYQQCYSGNGDNPIEIFKDCVKYICTGKTAEPCEALGPKLDMCPEIKGVSADVRDQCFPQLTIS